MSYALVHAGLVAALLLGLWATGRALAGACRAPIAATRLPTLATIGLGMVAWSTVLFALAALDWLRPTALRAAALAAAAAGALLALRAGALPALRAAPRAIRRWRTARAPGALALAGAGALAIALAASFLLSLDPRVEWDADTYHLTLPRIFLEHGGFVRIPYFVYSTWPLATEMLYAVALALRDHVLAAGLHFACGALLVVGVAALARQQAGPAAGVLAGALLLLDPSLRFELHAAYVDVSLALFVLLAWSAWEPAGSTAAAGARRALLALAGVFLGAAAGAKLIGGLAAAVFAALEIGRGVARRAAPRRLLVDLACLLLPALALALPWLARSAALTGDPLHPALHPILGGGHGEWSADLAARAAAYRDAYGMGRAPWDFLLLPLRLTAITGPEAALRFGGTLDPLWAALAPILVWGCFADRGVRGLALPGLGWTVGWFAGYQTVRLLLPALPFLAGAAAIACVRAVSALAPRRAGAPAGLALAVSAALAAASVHDAAPRIAEILALARRGERAVLDSAIPPHCRFVNAELAADARILMLGHNRSFFCHRAFLADSLFQASQMNELLRTTSDEAGLAALLRRLGVTHVLVADRDWGIDWPPHLRRALAAGTLLHPVYRDDEVEIYAVSRAAPSPARAGRRTPP